MDDFKMFAAVLGAVLGGTAVLFGGVFSTIRQIDHHFSVSACSSFHAASGYETKFVDYNLMSWDCLGKTANGKWISVANIHDVNVEPK